jgi:hypothetical protein
VKSKVPVVCTDFELRPCAFILFQFQAREDQITRERDQVIINLQLMIVSLARFCIVLVVLCCVVLILLYNLDLEN